jgi:hypothetical protein
MANAIRGQLCVLCWALCVLSLPTVSEARDVSFTILNALNSKPSGLERAYLARRLVKNSSWKALLAFKDSEDLDVSMAANWRCLELQVVAAGMATDKQDRILSDSELDAFVVASKQRLGGSPPSEWLRLLKGMKFSAQTGLTVLPPAGFVADATPTVQTLASEQHSSLVKSGERWRFSQTPIDDKHQVSVRTDGPIRQQGLMRLSKDTSSLLDDLPRIRTYSMPFLANGSDFVALLTFDHRQNNLVVESVSHRDDQEWATSIRLPNRIVGRGPSPVQMFGSIAGEEIRAFVACYSSIGVVVLDASNGEVQNLFWSSGPSD